MQEAAVSAVPIANASSLAHSLGDMATLMFRKVIARRHKHCDNRKFTMEVNTSLTCAASLKRKLVSGRRLGIELYTPKRYLIEGI